MSLAGGLPYAQPVKIFLCVDCHVVLPGSPGDHANHVIGDGIDLPDKVWDDLRNRQGLLRGFARGTEPYYTEDE